MAVNFDGTPTALQDSQFWITDFYHDDTVAAAYSSTYFASIDDDNGDPSVHLFDDNHNGLPDRYVTVEGRSGSITWDAYGYFTVKDNEYVTIGRMAYDTSGNVVGFYEVDHDYMYVVEKDTNPSDKLVGTFPIHDESSYTETGKLYDDNGDGVIDRLEITDSWYNQNMEWESDTETHKVTWSGTSFTANLVETIAFGGFDANGRPTYVIDEEDGNTPITWQASDANHVVAIISDEYETVKIYDTNGDNLPDRVSSTWYEDDNTPVTDTGHFEGWSSLSSTHPTVTIVLEISTYDDEIYRGFVLGSSSDPQVIIPIETASLGSTGTPQANLTTVVALKEALQDAYQDFANKADVEAGIAAYYNSLPSGTVLTQISYDYSNSAPNIYTLTAVNVNKNVAVFKKSYSFLSGFRPTV